MYEELNMIFAVSDGSITLENTALVMLILGLCIGVCFLIQKGDHGLNKDKPTYESVQDETGLTVTYDGDSHFFPSGVTQPEHPYYEEALKANAKGDIEALILLEVQAVREQIEAQAEFADRTEKWISRMANEKPRRRPKG